MKKKLSRILITSLSVCVLASCGGSSDAPASAYNFNGKWQTTTSFTNKTGKCTWDESPTEIVLSQDCQKATVSSGEAITAQCDAGTKKITVISNINGKSVLNGIATDESTISGSGRVESICSADVNFTMKLISR